MSIFVFKRATLFQQLEQVPGYRFPFSIRVSREIEGIGFFHRFYNRIDMLTVAINDLIFHRKIFSGVDSPLFWQ